MIPTDDVLPKRYVLKKSVKNLARWTGNRTRDTRLPGDRSTAEPSDPVIREFTKVKKGW